MRVLHVYKDYWPVIGGMENNVRALAEEQVARGHEVTVLVTAPGLRSNTEVIGGVRVVRAGRLANVSSAPVSIALVGALRRERPDVTHLHSPYPVGEAAWMAVGRPPVVISYQSDIVRQRYSGRLWAPWLRRLLAQADRVLASSPRYVESSPFLRAVRDRVSIVPPGIDPARFEAADPHAWPDITHPGGMVVFVGRLRYYKGLHVLVDALAELPEARLRIVGVGPEGDALRQRAARRGVDDRIQWLGEVPDADLPAVLSASDVFALPSTARSEAFGIVLLEAMAAGLPVVSTELGTGTSWINQDGVTGRVVPPGDPGALADALRSLLADPGARRRMGGAGRRRVRERFTAERMVDDVERIYAEVAA